MDIQLPASGFRFQHPVRASASGSWFQLPASGSRLPVSGFRFRLPVPASGSVSGSGFWLPVPAFGSGFQFWLPVPASGSGFQVRLPVPAASFRFPASGSSFRFQLPASGSGFWFRLPVLVSSSGFSVFDRLGNCAADQYGRTEKSRARPWFVAFFFESERDVVPKTKRTEPQFWALRYVHADNLDVIFFAWVAAGVGAPGWLCFSPARPDRTKPGEPDRTGKLIKPCGPQHDDNDEVWGGADGSS